MNIRSELRIAWFVDAYMKNPAAGLRILGTGSGRLGHLEKLAAAGRFSYTRLENMQNNPHGETTPIYWNKVADASYDAVVGGHGSANEKILELVIYKMARAVKPGGHICLVISQAEAATAVDAATLGSLALRNHMTPLHVSFNLAPFGADPAWYDDSAADLLLVAEKPLNWEDKPADEGAFCCTEDTIALCEEFVPKSAQPWAQMRPPSKKNIPASQVGRINYLVRNYQAASYLEINAHQGKNFSMVAAPVKVMVCPWAKPEEQADGATVIALPSDDFFRHLGTAGSQVRIWLEKKVPSLLFDIIFINGEHTFERSLRDFTNSLAYAHDDTLIILNASVPSDPYSALADRKQALAYRRAAGLEGNAWHGDVFKTVFAIHDLFPQYSYCTLTEKTTQTFIWRAERSRRTPVFSSMRDLDALDYFGMLRHAAALMPVGAEMLPKLIGKTLEPRQYSRPNSWKKLFYSCAVAVK